MLCFFVFCHKDSDISLHFQIFRQENAIVLHFLLLCRKKHAHYQVNVHVSYGGYAVLRSLGYTVYGYNRITI